MGAFADIPSASSAATSSALGTVQLAGNLGGTATAPTVVGLTIPSQAQGDVLYYNGTSWVRLGAGASGQALVTAGAAANPAWSTNFGAQAVSTTSTLSVGTTVATSGDIRLAQTSAIKAVDAAGTGVISIASAAAGVITYGGTANSGIVIGASTGNTILNQVAGTTVGTWSSTGLAVPGALSLGSTVASTGLIRAQNGTPILVALNGAGLADVPLVDFSSGNVLYVGSNAAYTAGVSGMYLSSGGTIYLRDGNGVYMYFNTGSNINLLQLNRSDIPAKLVQAGSATASATGQKLSILGAPMTGTTSTGGDLELGGGTGTSANGTISLINLATATAAPTAGAGSALPATPTGYVTIKINGTNRQIAYY